jgi:hypothetical protein
MTTEDQTKPDAQKELPAFYIFVRDTNGECRPVGKAWHRKQGRGVDIVIDKNTYVGFPPKLPAAPIPEEGA